MSQFWKKETVDENRDNNLFDKDLQDITAWHEITGDGTGKGGGGAYINGVQFATGTTLGEYWALCYR